jgi:hypothetical protein
VTTLVYQPVNTMNAFYIGQARDFLGPNDKAITAKRGVVGHGIESAILL